MWPILLDMTKEESMQHLRCLEIDAFSGLVNALRAQGSLNNEKLNLLKETSNMLHISQERHKAEIRRVVNDERLNTIAYHMNGERHCGQEWADEGQRLIPLMPRVAPQTAYSAIADEVADATSKLNKQLPLPVNTDRKRIVASPPTHSSATSTSSTAPQTLFRGVEMERKRKLPHNMENCVLAQHLMAPPKISKIQQIYRQKSMNKIKELVKLIKPSEVQQTGNIVPKSSSTDSPKLNILPHKTISSSSGADAKQEMRTLADGKIPTKSATKTEFADLAARPLATIVNSSLTLPTSTATASKTITTTDGQKLIVMSTHANLPPNPSILQRTLTTIPLKTLTVNPKYRLVSRVSNSITPSRHSSLNSASKQKLGAMRATNKRVVPYSNVQMLRTTTGLKVLARSKQVNIQTMPHLNDHSNRVKHSLLVTGNAGVSCKLKGSTLPQYPKHVLNIPVQSMQSLTTSENHSLVEGNTSEQKEHSGKVKDINGISEQEVIRCETIVDVDEKQSEVEVNDLTINDQPTCDRNHHEAEISSSELESDEVIPLSDEDVQHDNGVEETQSVHEMDTNHLEEVESDFDVAITDCTQQQPDSVAPGQTDEDHVHQAAEVFGEKVDLDSSVFIYDNDNDSAEVIIDGIDEQPIEVLNAVHTLDETLPNVKNVRS